MDRTDDPFFWLAVAYSFKEVVAIVAVSAIGIGACGYYLGQRSQKNTGYPQTYSHAIELADKDRNGTLDNSEIAELYRRAGAEPVFYNAKKKEAVAHKLTQSELEKAIASYKQ